MAQGSTVNSISVDDLLDKLRTREWMVPVFQRDFVWSIGAVSDLVYSILERRPIGMATIWQQPDNPELELKPVSLQHQGKQVELPGNENPPATKYAVLDGRQRCTAIALAFGGLRPTRGKGKFRGRFFLNVAEKEDSKRIEFVPETSVVNRGLDSDANAIGEGLFPLSSSREEESLALQWYRYSQSIKDPANYPNSQLPDEDELKRRDQILQRSFQGLIDTKLAVYIVPSSYSLSEICDIFEVLNTTGTKVSTVDLIHSWLFAETKKEGSPILLRDWIDSLRDLPGAVGWFSSSERPELIAQMVTAAYVSLESKPEARASGHGGQTKIASVKSGDLLATPTQHWQNVIEHYDKLVEFLGDFQRCVSDGEFGWRDCPYPLTAALYVGLRWHHQFDTDYSHPWEITDLDALFRAFFWRNALSSRYDQGSLTQLGTDIVQLKEILRERHNYGSFSEWAQEATKKLDKFMNKLLPTASELREWYSDRQTGSLQKALLLPIKTRACKDLLSEMEINFLERKDIQLHHIYPIAWCKNNITCELSAYLDPSLSDRDWIRSAANLMPLTRDSNLKWRAENPGAILYQREMAYATHEELFLDLFISERAFDHLMRGDDGIPHFWSERAESLASHMEALLTVCNR